MGGVSMEWKEVRLGDVCEIKHGFAYKGKYFSDTPTCDILVTPGNFTLSGGFKLDKPKFYNGPVEKDYILSKGDLIVTMTDLSKNIDTLGYSALVPEVKGLTFHHNQRIGLVENIANNVDKYFLYWIMRTPAYQSFIATHSSGTTVHHTSPKGIGNYVFKLPPLDDQRRIASILSSLDRKIELNNKINADLEEMAQAIFKNWFVDFEPFKGGKFEDSELGMIPEGWKVVKLGDFFPVKTGKKDANTASVNGKYPFFSCSQNALCTDSYSFDCDAILVAGNGDFNVKWYSGKFDAYQRTYVLIPYNKKLLALLYYVVKRNLLTITSKARGSVIRFITKGNLTDFEFAIPRDLENNEIVDVFKSINEKIFANIKENSRLSLLRNTLLPRLMSGEIEVSE